MTASPNRRYNEHHKATEEEGDQGVLGKEIWRKKCGQQDISIQLKEDGGGSTRQSLMETSGLWPVDYVPPAPGATRHKSSQMLKRCLNEISGRTWYKTYGLHAIILSSGAFRSF